MKLDAKFSGVIIKAKDASIVPPDEYIVFLAKDDALPATLEFYENECQRLGASMEQIATVRQMRSRLAFWRERNPQRCRVADVEKNELLLINEGNEKLFHDGRE